MMTIIRVCQAGMRDRMVHVGVWRKGVLVPACTPNDTRHESRVWQNVTKLTSTIHCARCRRLLDSLDIRDNLVREIPADVPTRPTPPQIVYVIVHRETDAVATTRIFATREAAEHALMAAASWIAGEEELRQRFAVLAIHVETGAETEER